jgi:hypothetical protein
LFRSDFFGGGQKDLRLITNNIYEKEVLFKKNCLFEIKAVDFQKGLVEMEEVGQTSSAIKLIGFYFETQFLI